MYCIIILIRSSTVIDEGNQSGTPDQANNQYYAAIKWKPAYAWWANIMPLSASVCLISLTDSQDVHTSRWSRNVRLYLPMIPVHLPSTPWTFRESHRFWVFILVLGYTSVTSGQIIFNNFFQNPSHCAIFFLTTTPLRLPTTFIRISIKGGLGPFLEISATVR